MEVEIASAADTTIDVVNPGWGDAMQANKAGLLEVADIFVINKADRAGVRETRRDLDQMLDLGGVHEWRPPILETVATVGSGITELWDAVVEHRTFIERGPLDERRRARMRVELDKVLSAMVRSRIGASCWPVRRTPTTPPRRCWVTRDRDLDHVRPGLSHSHRRRG
jgi:LAO/AO transport system kinase